jgi:hypothetical protein
LCSFIVILSPICNHLNKGVLRVSETVQDIQTSNDSFRESGTNYNQLSKQ